MTQQNKMREAFEKWAADKGANIKMLDDFNPALYEAFQAAWSHNEPLADNSGLVEWQPIETAPQTTKSILVYCSKRENTYVVHWGISNGFLSRHCWRITGGEELLQEPTHWQPLPCPPTAIQNNAKIEG